MPQNIADPDKAGTDGEMTRILERALLALPDSYRTVIMLRDIEELSTSDAAEILEVTEENLKVRLHRARSLLRKEILALMGRSAAHAFPFPAVRCDQVVKAVLETIGRK